MDFPHLGQSGDGVFFALGRSPVGRERNTLSHRKLPRTDGDLPHIGQPERLANFCRALNITNRAEVVRAEAVPNGWRVTPAPSTPRSLAQRCQLDAISQFDGLGKLAVPGHNTAP
jgi:hypothetical protein